MSCWRPLVMSDITQGELIWQSLQQLPFLSGSQSGCWHLIQLQTPVSRYLNTTQAVFMALQGPSPSLFRWPVKVYSYCSFFVGSLYSTSAQGLWMNPFLFLSPLYLLHCNALHYRECVKTGLHAQNKLFGGCRADVIH